MKVVINNCYGGFNLSHKAIMRYAEIKGIKLYPFVNVDGIGSRKFKPYDPKDDTKPFLIYYTTKPLNKNGTYKNKCWFSDREIPRNDPALVQVVKELKEKANGMCASLKVINIPDGIDWEVAEYDGLEHIDEQHESWG